jgi:hypothetical protein
MGGHSGQSGHGIFVSPRGAAAETFDSLRPTPVTGQHKNLTMVPFAAVSSTPPDIETPEPITVSSKPPPQEEFPKFDGDNPRLWCRACEKYFRVNAVGEEYWVEYATLHFVGNAALWFQSAEDKMGKVSWLQLCDTINKRFDRGQYQHLYHRSFHIRQTSSVAEYIERFDTLMHHTCWLINLI